MDDIWRPVSGYEGYYEISNTGRCRSIDRFIVSKDRFGLVKKLRRGKVLKAQKFKTGYVGFQLCREGKIKFLLAHRMVAIAFHGPCPDGHECGHLDGCRENNAVENLKWVTKKENQSHRVRHGTSNRGSNAHQARLLESDVIEARRMRSYGATFASIASKYGVSVSTIQHAVSGKNWAHVP